MSWRVARTTLAACIATVLLTGVSPALAQASVLINEVHCDRNDFLRIHVHQFNPQRHNRCFANAGERGVGSEVWLHEIHTGNNRVQWYGDGKWQPANPIGKWSSYRFPNHPGGVSIQRIRIL